MSSAETDRPRRILIVRLSHLGDVVHALCVYHALRAEWPQARIAWVTEPQAAELVAGLPGLERVVRFERRAGARAWPALARALEEFGADWAIDCQGNTKSALVTLASRAPRRTGLAREDWREPFGATALTDAAPALHLSSPVHAVDRMLHLSRHVAPRGASAPRFDVGLDASELDAGRARADQLGLAEGGAILHVAARGDVRSWPAARFEELARLLAESSRVVVVSGPAEAEDGRALAARLAGARIAHWPAQRGVRHLAAVFAAAAERGARFIGCDSGPMHLAWSCGLEVVLLAGPQDERRTGPWPPAEHVTLRAAPAPACAPCLSRRCDHPEGPVCMQWIRPEDVLVARAAMPAASRARAGV